VELEAHKWQLKLTTQAAEHTRAHSAALRQAESAARAAADARVEEAVESARRDAEAATATALDQARHEASMERTAALRALREELRQSALAQSHVSAQGAKEAADEAVRGAVAAERALWQDKLAGAEREARRMAAELVDSTRQEAASVLEQRIREVEAQAQSREAKLAKDMATVRVCVSSEGWCWLPGGAWYLRRSRTCPPTVCCAGMFPVLIHATARHPRSPFAHLPRCDVLPRLWPKPRKTRSTVATESMPRTLPLLSLPPRTKRSKTVTPGVLRSAPSM